MVINISFATEFEQHCEGMGPALYGSVRYESDIPIPVEVGADTKGLDITHVCVLTEPQENESRSILRTAYNLLTVPKQGLRRILVILSESGLTGINSKT